MARRTNLDLSRRPTAFSGVCSAAISPKWVMLSSTKWRVGPRSKSPNSCTGSPALHRLLSCVAAQP